MLRAPWRRSLRLNVSRDLVAFESLSSRRISGSGCRVLGIRPSFYPPPGDVKLLLAANDR